MDKKQNKLLEDLYMRDIKLGKHFDVLVCRQNLTKFYFIFYDIFEIRYILKKVW